MHCCVLHISCIQGNLLDPVSCRPLSFSQSQPWMLGILTHTHLVRLSISSIPKALFCLQRFWALQSVVLSIGLLHERSGSMVTHDCAPIARMSLPSPPRPVTPPSTANRSERRRPTRKKVQVKLDTFLRPLAPPPVDESDAVQLTGESSPPKQPRSPTAADDALLVGCLKKPAKRRCKALRLAQPLRRTRSAAAKLACLQYVDIQFSQRAAAKDMKTTAKSWSDWRKIRPQLEALVKWGSRKKSFTPGVP